MPGEFLKMTVTVIIGAILMSLIIADASSTITKSVELYKIVETQLEARAVLKGIIKNCFDAHPWIDYNTILKFYHNPMKLMKCGKSNFMYSVEISTVAQNYTGQIPPKKILIITDMKLARNGIGGKGGPIYGTMHDGLLMFLSDCTTPQDNVTILDFENGQEIIPAVEQGLKENYDNILVLGLLFAKNTIGDCYQHMNLMYSGSKIPMKKGTKVFTVVAEMNPICTNLSVDINHMETGAADLIEAGKYGEAVIAKSHYAVRGAMCMAIGRGPLIKNKPKVWLINTTSYAPWMSVSVPVVVRYESAMIPAVATLYIYKHPSFELMKKIEKVCKSGKPETMKLSEAVHLLWSNNTLCSPQGCTPEQCRVVEEKNQGNVAILKEGAVVHVK